jgi:hypothetical protein
MAKREVRRQSRPSEDAGTGDEPATEDRASEEAEETPPQRPIVEPRVEKPTRPPILLVVTIVAVGCLVILIVALTRSGSPSPAALFDNDREAHVALVGAWKCTKDSGDMRSDETLVLLDNGRYTRQQRTTGSGWVSREETSGSWQVLGSSLLFTAESCTKMLTTEGKLCEASHPLVEQLELPIKDEINVGVSCAPLKRYGKRSGS